MVFVVDLRGRDDASVRLLENRLGQLAVGLDLAQRRAPRARPVQGGDAHARNVHRTAENDRVGRVGNRSEEGGGGRSAINVARVRNEAAQNTGQRRDAALGEQILDPCAQLPAAGGVEGPRHQGRSDAHGAPRSLLRETAGLVEADALLHQATYLELDDPLRGYVHLLQRAGVLGLARSALLDLEDPELPKLETVPLA